MATTQGREAGTSQKVIFQKILVGYDGSPNAHRALNSAIALTKQFRGELRIAVVADTMRYSTYAGASALYKRYNEQTKLNAENLAEAALDTARRAGVADVYASAEEGQPADMVLTLATEFKADLIVLGRRGMRALERFLMGSVSNAVINHAKCDVLVVK